MSVYAANVSRLHKTLFCGVKWKDEHVKLFAHSLSIFEFSIKAKQTSYDLRSTEVIAVESITSVAMRDETSFEVRYVLDGKTRSIQWRCDEAKAFVKKIKIDRSTCRPPSQPDQVHKDAVNFISQDRRAAKSTSQIQAPKSLQAAHCVIHDTGR
jgi:hypothetical protein